MREDDQRGEPQDADEDVPGREGVEADLQRFADVEIAPGRDDEANEQRRVYEPPQAAPRRFGETRIGGLQDENDGRECVRPDAQDRLVEEPEAGDVDAGQRQSHGERRGREDQHPTHRMARAPVVHNFLLPAHASRHAGPVCLNSPDGKGLADEHFTWCNPG